MDEKDYQALEGSMGCIWDLAQGFGLDPFPTHFEVVPPAIMYEFGAYGLPGRFSHWSRGKAFHQVKTMYDYGLSRIYELVINTNPAYAFLMENNTLMQNKLVVAHVLGHVDFFKHNSYFGKTNRAMVESVATSAQRVREYEHEHGPRAVEEFLDAALAIEEHVDPWERPEASKEKFITVDGPYDDIMRLDSEVPGKVQELEDPPKEGITTDLLGYIMRHSPVLEDWQRDILGIVREESLYFTPQMRTKIMNEGWACYWHAKILRDAGLTDGEYTEFASLQAGVLAGSKKHLNPYLVGVRMWEDLVERGYDIWDIRRFDDDVSFIRNYLTPELVEDLDLYLYDLDEETNDWVVVEKDFEKIRDYMVNYVAMPYPTIEVVNGDHHCNRELYLRHVYGGIELDDGWAERTLPRVQHLWGRPVYLEAMLNDSPTVLRQESAEAIVEHITL